MSLPLPHWVCWRGLLGALGGKGEEEEEEEEEEASWGHALVVWCMEMERVDAFRPESRVGSECGRMSITITITITISTPGLGRAGKQALRDGVGT